MLWTILVVLLVLWLLVWSLLHDGRLHPRPARGGVVILVIQLVSGRRLR